MLSQARKNFPMLNNAKHPLIYFDSAATALKPQSVIDSMTDFYENSYGTIHRAVYDLSTNSSKMYHEARQKVAKFINAEKYEEIIFTSGTTESINLVASSFGKEFVKKGDEIIVTEMEHHSNIVPWQVMCESYGAKLKVAPIFDNGELDLEAFEKLLNEKTRLVSLTHVSNVLGTINPIKNIIKMAKNFGAYVFIDGAQAAPHQKIDVQDLNADFYAFSAHKMYGPTGIGILYGKEELLNKMPPYKCGGDMIEHVSFEKTTYNTLPNKFEAGTPPIVEAIGLGEAVDYMLTIGLDNIAKYERDLLDYATRKLERINGLKIIGKAKKKGSIISFIVDGIHSLDIGTFLNLKGICVRTGLHCAEPLHKKFKIPGTTRASFGIYNTIDEIDYFVKALQETINKLK